MIPPSAELSLDHFFHLLSVWAATATSDLDIQWILLGMSDGTWKRRHTRIKQT